MSRHKAMSPTASLRETARGRRRAFLRDRPAAHAILVYSRGVYPAQVGGREIFVADLVRELAESGRRVILLTEQDPGPVPPGVRVVEVQTTALPGVGFLIFALRAFMSTLAFRSDVDLIHAHSPRANVAFAGFLSAFFGKPLIVTAHCAGVDYAFSDAAYRHATKVIAVSESIARNLTDAGLPRNRLVVVPCVPQFPPTPATKAAAREILGIEPSAFVVLYLGRMDSHKGIHLLVEALRTWPQGRPIVAVLAGEGPARRALESSWNERPDVSVRWPGLVAHDRIGVYHRAADVFVLASLGEGSPLAIFEALHYGTPIISCDVPGVRDFLKDGVNARLVARSSVALREALVQVYDNRGLLPPPGSHSSADLTHESAFDQHLRLYELAVRSSPSEQNPVAVSHD